MCWFAHLGGNEGRQRYTDLRSRERLMYAVDTDANLLKEFSGTLLGFDDYVSK